METDRSEATRLFVASASFLTRPPLRKMLRAFGYEVHVGVPTPDDWVAAWGNSPTAWRSIALAERTGARLLRIEDSWLRGLHPGEGAGLGMTLDRTGVHFDGTAPSDLERLLNEDPLDDAALLQRARDGIARLKSGHLTKYTGFDPDAPVPDPGYVLVLDQTDGDASVSASGGDPAMFREMVVTARIEHPGARLLIKSHPDRRRPGYLTEDDGDILSDAVSPWALMEGAVGVYTLSSQMGFEAILAGHRPVVFGQPFYAGWGLTDDRRPPNRRARKLTAAQLFAGAVLLYPRWYDPFHEREGTFEDACAALEADTRAWREDHPGWNAHGMRLWKRPHIRRFFGGHGALRFGQGPRPLVWGTHDAPEGATRVEDGFLRSRGLGAQLVPPLSLVADTGLHYDPTRPTALDRAIARPLTQTEEQRSEALRRRLIAARLTKYAPDATPLPDLPEGHRVLVVGQVADDASVRLGAPGLSVSDLLQAARAARPEAVILFKPHPDVEAGLRKGDPPDGADVVLSGVDPATAIEAADEVWTLTSLLGFEALLRGVPVTCLGRPFYAGWGLTTDLGEPIPHRGDASLAQLIHGALIAYPRYLDPVTQQPCPVEVIVDRLESGTLPRPVATRLLAKAQGLAASVTGPFWR